MKKILYIFILFLLSFSHSIVFAVVGDLDNDGIPDELDFEINTPADQIDYVCTQDDIDNIPWYCQGDNMLGKYDYVKEGNTKDSDNDGVIDYSDWDDNTPTDQRDFVCTQDDFNDRLWGCDPGNLGTYNLLKEEALGDSDGDGVINQDDFQVNTPADQIIYICTQADLDAVAWGCPGNGWLGYYSRGKELSIIDSDNDGVKEAFDVEDDTIAQLINFICTADDITNGLYQCVDGDLGKGNIIKYNLLSDDDGDGINNFYDKDPQTTAEESSYICTQNDIDSVKYQCSGNLLGKFSQTKKSFFVDSDGDGIIDAEDQNNSTTDEHRPYICSQNDVINQRYQCSSNLLGNFSQIKKNSLIDSDKDGIRDIDDRNDASTDEEKPHICTQNDVDNSNYQCNINLLGDFSQTKKDFLVDSDGDNIVDGLDKEINTSAENIRYICREFDVDKDKFSCATLGLGAFSLERKQQYFDTDNDGILDFEDQQINTPEADNKYVCNENDVSQKRFNCNDSLLGVVSAEKKSYIIDNGIDILTGGLNLETGSTGSGTNRNKPLSDLKQFEDNDEDDDGFWSSSEIGEKGIYEVLVAVARDLKNVFFAVATVFFLYIVLRLLFSQNSEEDIGNFKKGLLWITIGLIIMQLAFSFVAILYDRGLGGSLAESLIIDFVSPLIALLETLAAFFFVTMAIVAVYRLIASNGDEQAASDAKTTFINAILGYILVRIAGFIVEAVYGKSGSINLDGFSNVIVTIINWLNGFVGIVVIIMIIYTGARVLFSAGDEETLTSAKKSLLYIIIGIVLLVINFLILTFFFSASTII